MSRTPNVENSPAGRELIQKWVRTTTGGTVLGLQHEMAFQDLLSLSSVVDQAFPVIRR